VGASILVLVGLALTGCGSSSPTGGAPVEAAPTVVERTTAVGLHLKLTVQPASTTSGCGPTSTRTAHADLTLPAPKPSADETRTSTTPVRVPSGDEVVVTDVGPIRVPYSYYAVVRVGPDVAQVEAENGPGSTTDQAAPVGGWVMLTLDGAVDAYALRVTDLDGSSRVGYLVDAGSACQPLPRQPVTPVCLPGQYQVSVGGVAGASQLMEIATVTPVGIPTCLLRATAAAGFTLPDGSADGAVAATDVDWILPLQVAWRAGIDCFARTEILNVAIGEVHVRQDAPGSDCTDSALGNAGAMNHPLSLFGVSSAVDPTTG
jgi:hypothetical protein